MFHMTTCRAIFLIIRRGVDGAGQPCNQRRRRDRHHRRIRGGKHGLHFLYSTAVARLARCRLQDLE